MTVKTITVTETAYDALKGLKKSNESFSEAILRISGRGSLREFIGALSKESADRLEEAIKERRRAHAQSRPRRLQRIIRELEGR